MSNGKINKPGPKCIRYQLERSIEETGIDETSEMTESGELFNYDGSAVVFSTATLTYLINKIVTLAASEAKNVQSNRITPRHLQMAIRGDEELDILLKQTIYGAGTILGEQTPPT